MTGLRLKLKLFLLLLLGVASVGKIERTANAVSCGKCDSIWANGQLIGYGCFSVTGATHGCIATANGCSFTDACGS